MSATDRYGSQAVSILSGTLVLALTSSARIDEELPEAERRLLSLVDGRRSVAEIAQRSGVPAARDHLLRLFERGVVATVGSVTESAPVQAAVSAVPAAPAPPAEPPSVPEAQTRTTSTNAFRIGPYEVATRIGQGGKGSIYVCRRTGASGFQKLFALKVVRQHSDHEGAAVRSFLREGRIGSLLDHPNLQSVVDMGTYSDQPFLVLDYVDGVSLAHLMGEGRPVAASVVVTVLLDTLRGLQAVHDLVDEAGRSFGLIHGDVSPPNILIGTNGTTRLCDLGSASFTAPGMNDFPGPLIHGRPAYMAPEQFLAQSLDCRADLFAVGVVMWEALTGKLLFAADGYDQSAINVMKKEVPPPSAFGAPSCLDEVCLRALSRARDSRYFNAEEMASALLRTAVGANLVASPRDVAQIVRMECGEVLAERRKKIQAAFAETEPAVAPVAAAPTAQLGSVRRMEPAKDQEVGEAEAPFETSPYQSLLERLKNARIMAKPHLYVPVGLALGTLLLFTMMFVFRWPSGSLTRQDRPVREPAHAASR